MGPENAFHPSSRGCCSHWSRDHTLRTTALEQPGATLTSWSECGLRMRIEALRTGLFRPHRWLSGSVALLESCSHDSGVLKGTTRLAQVYNTCCPCISKSLPATVWPLRLGAQIRDLQLRWVGGSGAKPWLKTSSSQCPVNIGQR